MRPIWPSARSPTSGAPSRSRWCIRRAASVNRRMLSPLPESKTAPTPFSAARPHSGIGESPTRPGAHALQPINGGPSRQAASLVECDAAHRVAGLIGKDLRDLRGPDGDDVRQDIRSDLGQPGLRLTEGAIIEAVNGRAFSTDEFAAAIENAQTGGPINLLIKRGQRFYEAGLDYREGPRYPRLEPINGARRRSDEIFASAMGDRKRRQVYQPQHICGQRTNVTIVILTLSGGRDGS